MNDQRTETPTIVPTEVHSEKICVICRESTGSDGQKVHKKGLDTLIKVSHVLEDKALHAHLQKLASISPIDIIYVHKRCRADYIRRPEANAKRAEGSESVEGCSTSKRLRSSLGQFDWLSECFLCGKPANIDKRHPDRSSVSEVTLIEFRASILTQCCKRDDFWGHSVMTRVNDCIDLVAAEARYHTKCYRDFHALTTSTRVGRPIDNDKQSSFVELCHWLDEEGAEEKMTVDEIHHKMMELANGKQVYAIKCLREKLYEHYGEHIFWSQVGGGRDDVLCFKRMNSYMFHAKWHSEKHENAELEAERIVRTCAKLLKEEIRENEYSKTHYPSVHDISSINKGRAFLTPLTRVFIETIIKDDVKRNSIGQSLTQAVRPTSLVAPILFGTAVEMDHVLGSKWLIDELFKLGFSISYDELTMYKQSILQEENLNTLLTQDAEVTQWACDNADHNVKTLDGGNQFHGMGMISMSAVHGVPLDIDQRVKRMARQKVAELTGEKGISIVQYIGPASPSLSSLKFKTSLEILRPYIIPPALYYSNLLWQSARVFNKAMTPTPIYTGFMQHFFTPLNDGIEKCKMLILPFIDLNPNEPTCIYSTLLYVNDQSEKMNQESASVTFDQPLWQKAVEIIESKSLTRKVCRLGGFHLLMSAVGSIGNIMKGSGIEEAIGVVYGSNTVTHILTGKAISRALRAHLLVEKALVTKLIRGVLPSESDIDDMERQATDNTDQLTKNQMQMLEDLNHRSNHDDPIALHEVVDSEELKALDQCILKHKTYLSASSRTAKLWMLYLEYVEVIKFFIACERIGDWEGHLTAVGKLLNLFAATGHINYAKCGRLYLQMMRELPDKHTWLYQKFIEGFHTIRRSDRYWAGLWTDLCIEQVLMRSMKARGGLTRGRGMTESVRHMWVYTMHHCAAVHEAMTNLTNQIHLTSEQHVELGKSRCKRDFEDLQKILDWVEQHDPFDKEVNTLRSLTTGLTASEEDALAQRESDDIVSYFAYELSAIPASLFKDQYMRKTDKSELARVIKNDLQDGHPTQDSMPVIDGGWLLHHVRWKKNASYSEIAEQYDSYLSKKFGMCCVVFDGYHGPSTKDHEHLRRSTAKKIS